MNSNKLSGPIQLCVLSKCLCNSSKLSNRSL